MSPPGKRKIGELGNPVISESEVHRLMEMLLALDRTVLELSMRLYNVPRRDQSIMREQNRRLHDAVRKRAPSREL